MRALACAVLAAVISGAAVGAQELPPQVSAVPIPEGQVETAVGRLDEIVADVRRRTGVPGIAVAVVSGGAVAFTKGYGVLEAGKRAPVDADTVFQLASVSKSVGATVVATRIGDALRWDTPVTELLPWFALADPRVTQMLTIGDLYSHRSGLPDHAGDDLEDIGYDRRQVLERLRFAPLHSFRDEYAYTNFGLTAAAEAVAVAAGTDWATLSETAIYRPLGMTRTSSRFADYIGRDNRAVPHMRTGDGWAPREQREPDAQSPAGGVSSSVADMAKWMLMVLDGGRRAGPAARGAPAGDQPAGRLRPALRPRCPRRLLRLRLRRRLFALGPGRAQPFRRLRPRRRDGLSADPLGRGRHRGPEQRPADRGGGIRSPSPSPTSCSSARSRGTGTRRSQPLIAPVMAPLGRLAGATPPTDPAPGRAPAAYAGTYANDYFGAIEIAEEGGGLVLKAGPKPVAYPLTHWTGDSFVFEPGGENAPDGTRSEVSFRMGADTADTVTVEFWNGEGLGTFTR